MKTIGSLSHDVPVTVGEATSVAQVTDLLTAGVLPAGVVLDATASLCGAIRCRTECALDRDRAAVRLDDPPRERGPARRRITVVASRSSGRPPSATNRESSVVLDMDPGRDCNPPPHRLLMVRVKVKRIVANIETPDPAEAQRFYGEVLGLDVRMDLGWIATYGSDAKMTVQVSFLSEGGSGTPVPALSIEVDDLDAVPARMHAAKLPIEYGPVDEPWGVRRFCVRDPFGKLVNVLAHR